MQQRLYRILFLLPLALLCLQPAATMAKQDRLSVYVVNYPLAYFAKRIGGKQIEVHFPVPRDADPAFWKPDAATIARFQSADLILLNGAGYAKWIDTVSLPRARSINTSATFAHDYISEENTLTHSHGPSGEHAHAGTAFVTWLDFRQAIAQAGAIKRVLSRLRPEYEADFARNYQALENDLLELDKHLFQSLGHDSRHAFLASHPVFQYLARRYNMNIKSVTWEPNEFPVAVEWRAFAQLQKSHAVNIMLWESKPLPVTERKLSTQSVSVVVFDPCANIPAKGDFLTVMRQNINNLETAIASPAN